jgi:hypothetical protein
MVLGRRCCQIEKEGEVNEIKIESIVEKKLREHRATPVGFFREPLLLLNTSIVTTPGLYRLSEPITKDQARWLVRWAQEDYNMNMGLGWVSSIGHQAAADILTDLLAMPISVNRIATQQQVGQVALVFKLNGRPPEGKIFTRQEVEEFGYFFQILERFE